MTQPSLRAAALFRWRVPPHSVPIAVFLAGVLLVSVAAAIWDRWPGDVEGMRLLQSVVNDRTWKFISWMNVLGHPAFSFLLAAAAAGWLVYRGLRRPAVVLMAIIVMETAVVYLTKWAVHRPRPILPSDLQALVDASGYSFPSGHVVFAVTLFGGLAYLLTRHWKRTGWLRWSSLALLLALAALMGPARVSSGVHWPSDVLGGYLLSFLGVLLLVRLHERTRPSPAAQRRNATPTDWEAVAPSSDPRLTPVPEGGQ